MVNRYYSTTAAQAQLTSSLSSAATTINIDTTTGWPSSFPFTLIIDPNTASEEVVECTGVAGLSATVLRGVDGSTGLAHTVGAKVQHGVSARDFAEPQVHMAASTGVHGLVGGVAVVGTSTTQTLTNKSVDGGTNTLTNIADTSVPGWNTHKTTTDTHHEIDPHDTASNALLIKGLASQSADLQVWKDSTTAVLGYLGPDGTFGAGAGGAADLARFRVCGATRIGDAASKGTVNIKAASTTKPILRVDGTGQAAGGDLLSAVASNGTSITTLDKDGNLSLPGTLGATSGASTLQSLTVNNNATVTGNLTVSGVMHGAVKVCTSGTRPGSPSTGDVIFETDTGRVRLWNGTVWLLVAGQMQRVKTQRLTTQNATNATFTDISWTSADTYDADNLHDTVTNPHLVTVNEAGMWHWDYAIVGTPGSGSGTRVAFMSVNGGATRYAYNEQAAASTGTAAITGAVDIYMSNADNVRLTVWQNTGGTLTYAGDANSYLSGHYVHP